MRRPLAARGGLDDRKVLEMAREVKKDEWAGPRAALANLNPVALKALGTRPKVSVLITCFNYGAFVGQAIESVSGQTHAVNEIIVSDDASQDNSCEVVESYIRKGLPVTLLRNPHGGMAANLNSAFREASGDIVCLLDADDTFLPRKVEAVVEAFRLRPEAGLAIHRASLVDNANRAHGVYPLLSALPSGDCAQLAYDNSGILMGLPPTTNLSLRREIAERIFPIPEEYTGYAEQMIHRMAPFMTELCAIDEPLARWRMHGANDQNSSRVTPQRLQRELQIMDSLWLVQRRYLAGIDGDLAESFPRIERNPLYLKMSYIRLRLNSDPATRQAHADLCRYGLRPGSRVDQFWRHSHRLPRPLFQMAVDLLLTQSIWKELVSRTVRRRPSGKAGREAPAQHHR